MYRWMGMVLIAAWILPAQAEIERNKDWVWDTAIHDFAYAATYTEEGRVLGQYCYYDSEICYYMVSLGITCTEGAFYPALINTDIGVKDLELVCGHKIGNENVFYIKPFDKIDDTVRAASNIGFAIAMQSGHFKVVRFSLSGSTFAIESMRRIANDKLGEKPATSNPNSSEQYL